MAVAKLVNKIVMWPVANLIPNPNNARTHSPEQVAEIAASIRQFGFVMPVLVRSNGELVAGHGRRMAAEMVGLKEVPAIVADHLTDDEARAYTLADNKIALNAGWDKEMLLQELEAVELAGLLEFTGFSDDEMDKLMAEVDAMLKGNDTEAAAQSPRKEEAPAGKDKTHNAQKLNAQPINILDGRDEGWRGKAEWWEAKGVKTPGFDPVLAGLLYQWFCPDRGTVFDPYAGAEVRGMVAALMGLQYVGIDADKAQVDANRKHWQNTCEFARVVGTVRDGDVDSGDVCPVPVWQTSTAAAGKLKADFVLTEVPEDGGDLAELSGVIAGILSPHRFAALVVQDWRDEAGRIHTPTDDVLRAFEADNMQIWNKAIYIPPVPVFDDEERAKFGRNRTMPIISKNVLIFIKGDYKNAAKLCREAAFAE